MSSVLRVPSCDKYSPSSGLFRVKVYNEHGMAERNDVGLFARMLTERFPVLPVEEEGWLRHHLNRYPMPAWVGQQVVVNPHPKELVLRNHV